MKNISLKLEEAIFAETEALLDNLSMSRNKYINEAIDYYNRVQRRAVLAKQLAEESALVANDSLSVLSEFEALEDEDQQR